MNFPDIFECLGGGGDENNLLSDENNQMNEGAKVPFLCVFFLHLSL